MSAISLLNRRNLLAAVASVATGTASAAASVVAPPPLAKAPKGGQWVDDCDSPAGPEDTYSLSAQLEGEAADHDHGDDLDRLIARLYRAVAADARRRGILSAAEYLRRVR